MDVALAAFKLTHLETSGGADEPEEEPKRRPTEPAAPKRKPGEPETRLTPSANMSRIYVGAGRLAGIQPQNLVGAIVAEGMTSHVIGVIEIADKYSLIELPESLVDEAIRVMRNGLIKGKKPIVRRFVEKRG